MAGSSKSRVGDFLKTLTFLAILAVCSAWFAAQSSVELAGIPKILDGDSLRLNDTEIRLLGIDAPEYDQSCISSQATETYPCGRRAADMLKKLVGGRSVVCDGWQTDKYDRLLAVCSVGGFEINNEMVRLGWAVSFGGYEGPETIARKNKLGLWSGEFENPSTWRRNRSDAHASGWFSAIKFW